MREAGRSRDFRLVFAACTDCRCLRDFFCGSWPAATEFVDRFIHGLPAMELRGCIPHLLCLYRDLTALVRSIVGTQGVLHGPVQIGDLAPPVGFVSDWIVHKFRELSKRDVRRLLGNTTFN
ncbi:uncharacterized protein PHALS_08056 [Plasmopara halstedii]|uniref:Uncharacterized protein n=1 Tax=Plasmopara halstedii TaxID=4781 RepID=A0A0N7L8N1_PLAHL|nr:uncharacterized protein PHALS_08056 [Plasmopara halstedii]CEG50339.1 hypothetical protein PHALS_08056 [Plasmopara halstedii]|eukprot:XP_024586708.1 hypothetical protein PHALS_08056 [Plasmopara halstedii]